MFPFHETLDKTYKTEKQVKKLQRLLDLDEADLERNITRHEMKNNTIFKSIKWKNIIARHEIKNSITRYKMKNNTTRLGMEWKTTLGTWDEKQQ